jgi:hypothetical protein
MRLMDLSKAQGARGPPVADRGVAHHARCLGWFLIARSYGAPSAARTRAPRPRGYISRCGPVCLFRFHTAAGQVRARTYRLGATPGSIRRTAIAARRLTRDVSDSSRTTRDKNMVTLPAQLPKRPPPSSLRADPLLRGYARPVRQPGIGRRENLPAERHFRNDIVVIPSVNNGTLSGSIGRIVRKRPTRGTSEGAGTARLRPSETPLE